jgi:nitroreductase
METMNVLLERRSCKGFKPDPVPENLLNEVLETAKYAPSGMGKQAPIVLCVTNKEIRDRLSRLNAAVMGQKEGFDPFYGAPVVLVVLADKNVRTYLYDGSLAMGALMYAAWDKGLGSCWIHRAKEVFDSEEGKAILKELGIEGNYEGIGNCVIGYRDEEIPYRDRLPRKENYIYYVR